MYSTNLKQLRKELNLSAQKLADKLGVSQSSIAQYELGNREPNYNFLLQLYLKMGINLNWFVSGQGEMFITDKKAPQSFEAQVETIFNKLLEQKGII